MARWLVAALGVGVAVAAVPQPSVAEPFLKQRIVNYDVTGATPAAVRADLDRLGPIHDVEKRRADAITRWQVRWTYRFRNVGQDCSVQRVRITVEVTITMPRLKADAGAPAELARAFDAYSNKLMTHQVGHIDIAMDAAKRIEAGMLALKPESTCDAMARAANALGQSLLKEAAQKDVEHGRTLGARFP